MTGNEGIKHTHLIAGKLDEHEIGIMLTVLIPRVIDDEFPLLKVLTSGFGGHRYHRRNVVNKDIGA